MPERIYTDIDGKEIRREPMKRGRQPKGSYKDSDGNLICPAIVTTEPIKVEKKLPQEVIQRPIQVRDVKNIDKIKSVSEDERLTLDDFLHTYFHSIAPIEKRDGLLFIHNAYIKKCWYLSEYKKDIFNSVFPLIVVDPKENIIRIWSWYGPKKKDEQENVYYDFEAITPAFIVKDLLRPEDQH